MHAHTSSLQLAFPIFSCTHPSPSLSLSLSLSPRIRWDDWEGGEVWGGGEMEDGLVAWVDNVEEAEGINTAQCVHLYSPHTRNRHVGELSLHTLLAPLMKINIKQKEYHMR